MILEEARKDKKRTRGNRGRDVWVATQLSGREFEQTLGNSEGCGSLVCCSPRGHKELDTTEQLNNNWMTVIHLIFVNHCSRSSTLSLAEILGSLGKLWKLHNASKVKH